MLCATALGHTVAEAQKRAYALMADIHWNGSFSRQDIGYRAIAREQGSNPPHLTLSLKGEGIYVKNSFLSAAGAEIFVRHQQQLRESFRRFKPRHTHFHR